jgi:hypothetical protein
MIGVGTPEFTHANAAEDYNLSDVSEALTRLKLVNGIRAATN